MEFNKKHVKAIIKAGLISAPESLSSEDLEDAAYNALCNDGPVVEEFSAEQDKGAYSITVRGVKGAYFVQAMEYDDLGVFDDLESAVTTLESHYGEFMIGQ